MIVNKIKKYYESSNTLAPDQQPASSPLNKMERLFQKKLLSWHKIANHRQLPWKGEKDPYKIWLSEVILQQTRVDQGLRYYQNFISRYPNLRALAEAPEQEVYRLWQGLGYYSRCKNLIEAARYMGREMNCRFPTTYQEIKTLKGVGEYTAAAIASFAFGHPHAVVDGNVYRVLSRAFAIDLPIDSSEGKKVFRGLAQKLLPAAEAAAYNQAIMDFGATVCKPLPACQGCFFLRHCKAQPLTQHYPVKTKKPPLKTRWMNYFALLHQGKIAVQLRKEKDIWANLYQFYLIESFQAEKPEALLETLGQQSGLSQISVILAEKSSQKLTHQQIFFNLMLVKTDKALNLPGFEWVPLSRLQNYAFPKTLAGFLKRIAEVTNG